MPETLTPERLEALVRRARWDNGIAALVADRQRLVDELATCKLRLDSLEQRQDKIEVAIPTEEIP